MQGAPNMRRREIMDMATKPGEKFLFDIHLFEAEGSTPEESAPEIDPPPVVFSEAELEAAKAQAFAEGRRQAELEAAESRARHLAAVMEALARDTSALFAQEHLRENLYEREAVDLTLRIFEKLFPAYSRSYGFDELKAFILTVLEQHNGRKKIEIFVEPDLVEGVETFMHSLAARYSGLGFTVAADAGLTEGACKIRWEDGGAVRDSQAIAGEIHNLLREALAGNGTKGHDEKALSAGAAGDGEKADE